MVGTVAALLIAGRSALDWFSGGAHQSAKHDKTLYDQLVTQPDPKNGYEDYLRAADATGIAQQPYRVYASGVGQIYLEEQKNMVDHDGRALSLLRSGNQKQAWNPGMKTGQDLKHPQLDGFFYLPRLCAADAYVRFAEGQSAAGTQSLIDGLTFSERIRSGSNMDFLIGIVASDTLFTRCAELVPALSDRDALRLAAFADSILSQPDPYLEIVRIMRESKLRMISTIFNEKPDPPMGDKAGDAAIALLGRLLPAERQAVRTRLEDDVNRRYIDYVQRLQGPESQWYVKVDESYDENAPMSTVDDLVRYLCDVLAPKDYAETLLINRTEMRLLGLHARIVDYRWHHGKLPPTLAEAVPANLAMDPATGSDFVYEPNGEGTYRLYSKGFGSGGPIELGHQESRRRTLGSGMPPPGE